MFSVDEAVKKVQLGMELSWFSPYRPCKLLGLCFITMSPNWIQLLPCNMLPDHLLELSLQNIQLRRVESEERKGVKQV